MEAAGLFEPDVLMGDEWGATFRRRGAMSSEKRLMLAVLKNALQSYQKYALAENAHESQLFDEVAEWIDCDYSEWFFSFQSICENLEINPVYLRRRLVEWRRHALDSRPVPCRSAP
jgi:hypothetical protein